MRSQALSIDMLIAIFLLLGISFVTFSWTYEDIGYIKAYDFAAIIHKTNFTNSTYLASLEDKYNISISVSCDSYTYAGSEKGKLFVKRIAWYKGEICEIEVGI